MIAATIADSCLPQDQDRAPRVLVLVSHRHRVNVPRVSVVMAPSLDGRLASTTLSND